MKKFNDSNLPNHILEKLTLARENQEKARQISALIANRFYLCDLQVAISATGVSISGIVDNEDCKHRIGELVAQYDPSLKPHNGLDVMVNETIISICCNGHRVQLTTLGELGEFLEREPWASHREITLDGHGDSRMVILFNGSHAMGVYMRFTGDSGFTTLNPQDTENTFQDFRLNNGQVDVYPTNQLLEHTMGMEIARYYLLTGERYPGVDWREEV